MSIIDRIAKLCHEINRVYFEGAGNFANKHWEDLSNLEKLAMHNLVIYYLDNENTSEEDARYIWEKNMDHNCEDLKPISEEDKVKYQMFKMIINAFVPPNLL